MSNNKLKNMIENHELDDFVTNTDLSNKLRNTKTSEEVLELLKKYNYNESKEVFEMELIDLLKEHVTEQDLLKVSGGKLNRQNFSKVVTSLALAGALCVPAPGPHVRANNKGQVETTSSASSKHSKLAMATCASVGMYTLGVISTILIQGAIKKADKRPNLESVEAPIETSTHIEPTTTLGLETYLQLDTRYTDLISRPEMCELSRLMGPKYSLPYIATLIGLWLRETETYYGFENGQLVWKSETPWADRRWLSCVYILMKIQLASISAALSTYIYQSGVEEASQKLENLPDLLGDWNLARLKDHLQEGAELKTLLPDIPPFGGLVREAWGPHNVPLMLLDLLRCVALGSQVCCRDGDFDWKDVTGMLDYCPAYIRDLIAYVQHGNK